VRPCTYPVGRLAAGMLITLPCLLGQQHNPEKTGAAVTVYRRHITIPMSEAGPAGLDGWLVVPRTVTKPPLVLLSDGSHFSHLHEVGPGDLLPEAMWFVRRGWAVAMVSRRGAGLSGGEPAEKDLEKMSCSPETWEFLQGTNAQDLRAAYSYLTTQPDVDATRTIATGFFTAGSAAMWLTSGPEGPPAGLRAVINFSGGWKTLPDWMLQGKVHAIPDAIVPSFAKLGSTVRTPMLWLYPRKGSSFGLKSALAAKDAFAAAGGDVRMEVLKHEGKPEQFLFDENPAEWGPIVEQFLASLNLPAVEIIPVAKRGLTRLPKLLSDEYTKQALLRYDRKGPVKAFALSPGGSSGYSWGKATIQQAEHEALSKCNYPDCKIIASEQ